MNQRSRYGHRYIPGPIERTREDWLGYLAEAFDAKKSPPEAHFIPVLGGCFVVVPNIEQLFGRSSTAVIESFMAWQQMRHPPVAATGSIMVIDDDQATLKLIRIVCEEASFTVQSYGDAFAALAALEGGQEPDVLVVDLRMPGMDGWEFIRQVKSRDLKSRVVVAAGQDATQAEAELGADASLTKPFDPDDLIQLLRAVSLRAGSEVPVP